jgi:hypothetical protein
MVRYLLFMLLVIYSSSSSAQLNFFYNIDLYGRSVDGLGKVLINNLYNQGIQGQLSITVKEMRTNQLVIQVITPVFNLSRGQNHLPATVWANATIQNGGSDYAMIAQQTRSFPPGLYQFCFIFSPSDKSIETASDCVEGEIQPLIPMQLVDPVDRDSVCSNRPILIWHAPIPVPASASYRILLVEKTGDPVESILANRPVLALSNLTTTTLPYPGNLPPLQEGKTYCWQVFTVDRNVMLSKSEIWEFTVGCNEKAPPVNKDAYRELKSISNGNYYIADNYIKFSYQNRYNSKKLNYSIFDFNDNGNKIKNLPIISLQPGLNKIDLDVSDIGLENGKVYLLKVYPFNEDVIVVQFKFIAK